MRVMVLLKANKDSEAGVLPSQEILASMGKYNEELVKAGVMLAGEGLHPSSKGVRVVFSAKGSSVIDGPFAEAKELVAGYWLWQVKSMDEAIQWIKRSPFAAVDDSTYGGDIEVELRPVFEADDFGDEFTPELRAQEERIREQVAARQSS